MFHIPPAPMHYLEPVYQFPQKAPPNLSSRCIVFPRQHYGEFLPPSLTSCIICDPPTELSNIVGVQPVYIDFPETYICRCGYVARCISILAISLCIQPPISVWIAIQSIPFMSLSICNFSFCNLLYPFLQSLSPYFYFCYPCAPPYPPSFPCFLFSMCDE